MEGDKQIYSFKSSTDASLLRDAVQTSFQVVEAAVAPVVPAHTLGH